MLSVTGQTVRSVPPLCYSDRERFSSLLRQSFPAQMPCPLYRRRQIRFYLLRGRGCHYRRCHTKTNTPRIPFEAFFSFWLRKNNTIRPIALIGNELKYLPDSPIGLHRNTFYRASGLSIDRHEMEIRHGVVQAVSHPNVAEFQSRCRLVFDSV